MKMIVANCSFFFVTFQNVPEKFFFVESFIIVCCCLLWFRLFAAIALLLLLLLPSSLPTTNTVTVSIGLAIVDTTSQAAVAVNWMTFMCEMNQWCPMDGQGKWTHVCFDVVKTMSLSYAVNVYAMNLSVAFKFQIIPYSMSEFTQFTVNIEAPKFTQ